MSFHPSVYTHVLIILFVRVFPTFLLRGCVLSVLRRASIRSMLLVEEGVEVLWTSTTSTKRITKQVHGVMTYDPTAYRQYNIIVDNVPRATTLSLSAPDRINTFRILHYVMGTVIFLTRNMRIIIISL